MRPYLPLLTALVLLFPGCRGHRSSTPDWVRNAPPSAILAFSGQLGWLLERPDFQDVLRRYPMAEQTLELFLKKAHIVPSRDPGRLSLYVLDPGPSQNPEKTAPSDVPRFLIQLAAFRDPEALQRAVVASFPAEGSLLIRGQEWPLHVVFDLHPWHIRILLDEAGRVWLGDLTALEALTQPRRPDPSLHAAMAWVDSGAPLQGFLRPDSLLQRVRGHLSEATQAFLPQGLDALAWSVTPSAHADGTHRFALSLTGNRGSIQRAAPWMHRFTALLDTAQGAHTPPADLLEEPTRIGVRAQLTTAQLEAILARLEAPSFRFDTTRPTPAQP